MAVGRLVNGWPADAIGARCIDAKTQRPGYLWGGIDR